MSDDWTDDEALTPHSFDSRCRSGVWLLTPAKNVNSLPATDAIGMDTGEFNVTLQMMGLRGDLSHLV